MAQTNSRNNDQGCCLLVAIGLILLIGASLGGNHNSNSSSSLTDSTASTTGPTIPELQSSYSGTSDCTSVNCSSHYSIELRIDSQDQEGGLKATTTYNGNSSWDCMGTVTTNKSITLRCSNSRNSYHIEGTDTFDNSHTYHDILS
jgi:hypothetical protein